MEFSESLRVRLTHDQRHFTAGIEASLAAFEARHRQYEAAADHAAREISGAGHQSATALITSQSTNLAARMVGLTEGFIDLANDDNTYAAPPVVRALHETCCVPCYMAENLLPRLRKGKVNDVHRLLYRLGLGTGPNAGFGHIRPVGVPALNKSAERWIDTYLGDDGSGPTGAEITRMVYGPLSDRSHPNFGAVHHGSTNEPGFTPTYTLRPRFTADLIDQLLSGGFVMLLVAGEALDAVVGEAAHFDMPFPPGEPTWHDGDLWPDAPTPPA